MTNNTGRTPVAANQGSGVFDDLEDNLGRLDAKLTEALTVSVDSTSESLTSAQMQANACFILNTGSPAPGGPVTLTVAAVEIGRFTVVNNTSQTVTVTISGQVVTAPTVASGSTQTFISDGVNVRAAVSAPSTGTAFELVVAASDETTTLTTGTAKVTFRMPRAVTLTAVRASLTTASSSGVVTVDINEGGVSILSTAITIDANEKTSTTAATPPVISDSSLADDAEMTIDIDTAGTGAKGLKVALIGTRS
ncbi:Phage protein [Sinorhizobium sojae CCBAU 05684]|uniref:Phage protein n=1 Tax=Sinorhizobium sojae CCBAU 05684 TaxID=716928 RepID=A0A249P9J6_9HYPH|nr:hypothetical protein [Sinorhizobium sojae]ASY62536.1 Phage protein [Sinorhizobium sojae CCBAU 05684]